jgi:hypothetical protein
MIEYRFRVPSATVFTLYSYSKALEYPLEYPTADSLKSRRRVCTKLKDYQQKISKDLFFKKREA